MDRAWRTRTAWAVMAFAVLSGGIADAHEVNHGDLTIAHPFISVDSKCGKGATRAYAMLVVNSSEQSDRLTGASLGRTGKGVLMRTTDRAEKTPLPDGIEIPPGTSIAIMPPHYAIEFGKTSEALEEDGMVMGSLTFKRTGTVPVAFRVDAHRGDPALASACKPVATPAHKH